MGISSIRLHPPPACIVRLFSSRMPLRFYKLSCISIRDVFRLDRLGGGCPWGNVSGWSGGAPNSPPPQRAGRDLTGSDEILWAWPSEWSHRCLSRASVAGADVALEKSAGSEQLPVKQAFSGDRGRSSHVTAHVPHSSALYK
jgi:hypothetical protein